MKATPKISMEIPLHIYPLCELVELGGHHPLQISLYGGFPDSPLNGGRLNVVLDGRREGVERTARPSEQTVADAREAFFETIEAANRQGIECLLAFTNIFIEEDELNDENLAPVDWLARIGRTHGVRNGVILNNDRLTEHLRRTHGGELRFVSSCTRYFTPERILTPLDTLPQYLEDAERYDLVTITPQDSRRVDVLEILVEKIPGSFVAIGNSYCDDGCNSYHHYEALSRMNKKPIGARGFADVLDLTLDVAVHSMQCPLITGAIEHLDVAGITSMQISNGVTHIKLGRGRGAERVREIVEVIERQTTKSDTGQPVREQGPETRHASKAE